MPIRTKSSNSTQHAASPISAVGANNRSKLSHLSDRIFNTPLMIHPLKLQVIMQDLGSRFLPEDRLQAALSELAPHAAYDVLGQINLRSNTDRKSYEVTETGIAIIPVEGALLKKSSWMTSWSGTCTYEDIGKQFADAINDVSVKAVLFDIDSPGGETHGAFELSDLIYNARGSKPIYACANDLAASAAYAIASACDKIYVTITGAVGSIGVYCMHYDQEALDQKLGVKYTFIYAGERKVDGNPHEPLSKSAKSEAQAEINRQYDLFVSAVSRNRKLSSSAVIDTKAMCYFANNAVPALADAVGTLEDAVMALEERLQISGVSSVSVMSPSSAASISLPLSSAAGATTLGATSAIPVQLIKSQLNKGDTPMVKPNATAAALDAQIKELQAQRAACDPPASEPDAATAPAGEPDGDEDEDMKAAKIAATAALSAIDSRKRAAARKPAVSAAVIAPPVAAAVPSALAPVPAATAAAAEDVRPDHVMLAEFCRVANCESKLAGYIMNGTSLAAAMKEVNAERAAASHANPLDSTHSAGVNGGTALDRMEAAAAQFMAANPGTTKAKAYEHVITTQPQAYHAYEEERAQAFTNSFTKKTYVNGLKQKFSAMGLGTGN